MGSPAALFAVACGFIAAVFLLGGGSRGDILSLVVLRPLAVLAAGYAAAFGRQGAGPQAGAPWWLLLSLMALMALQLVPLPHLVWAALPGREVVADTDRLVGLANNFRAASLAPSRTWNSLLAMAVPLSAFLLAGSLDPRQRRRLLLAVYVAAAVSALLALLQVLGPSGGPFRLYRITNPDNPVGLFANRNHHAIFLASLLPLMTFSAVRAERRERGRPLALALSIGGALLVVPLILVSGSRTGATLLVAALLLSGLLWLMHLPPEVSRRGGPQGSKRGLWLGLGIGGGVVAIALASFFASRSPALYRLFEEDLDGELRLRILPQLLDMIEAYFPVGSGFGTFDLAYKLFEPFGLLRLSYLNHAHNDALQFLIEGGLVGFAILAGFLAWFAQAGWRAYRSLRESGGRQNRAVEVAPFAWSSLAVLVAGSLGDYPLRTPSLMLLAALLCVLARPGAGPSR